MILLNPITNEIYVVVGPTPGGGGGGGGSSRRVTHSTSTAFTIPDLTTDYLLNVNTTSADVAITLPDAVANDGFVVTVKRYSGSHNVTFITINGQDVDGLPNGDPGFPVLSGLEDSYSFGAVGGNWSIV